jgi:hypothetical protein
MFGLWERQAHIEILQRQPGVDSIPQEGALKMSGAFLFSEDHRREGHDGGAAHVVEYQFWRGRQDDGYRAGSLLTVALQSLMPFGATIQLPSAVPSGHQEPTARQR